MAQARNSNRRSSLDDKKERAAGRHKNPLQGRERDFGAQGRSGQIGGAFGAGGGNKKADERGAGLSKGAGGGGRSTRALGE
jgi:hypothetical protein